MKLTSLHPAIALPVLLLAAGSVSSCVKSTAPDPRGNGAKEGSTNGPPGGELRIEELPPKGRTFPLRTGAHRTVPNPGGDYLVTYEAREGWKLGILDAAVARDQVSFQVGTFSANSGRSFENPDVRPVPEGAEIVEIALASQLEAMGYVVALDFSNTMEKRLQEGIDYSLQVPSKFIRLYGNVDYWIARELDGGRHRTTSSLTVDLVVAGIHEDAQQKLYSQRFEAEESIPSEKLAGFAGREKNAARTVLDRIVEKVINDEELQRALVTFYR